MTETNNYSNSSAFNRSSMTVGKISPTDRLVAKIMKIVEKEFEDPTLNVKKLGEEKFFLTPDYLGRLFKRKTGLRINEYICICRIEKAKLYLLENKYKIYEVAKMCGFGNNAKHFSHVFKKYTGILPRDFK